MQHPLVKGIVQEQIGQQAGLTLLRVLLVHAPLVLLPGTIAGLLANSLAGLGLTWWEFLLIWSLWPITAVPHAIVEYYISHGVDPRPLVGLWGEPSASKIRACQGAAPRLPSSLF